MESLLLPDASNLRPVEEPDAVELYALIDRNRDHLSPWMPWADAQTLEDTIAFIERARRQLAASDGFQAAIVEERSIVGVVGYHAVDWANRATRIGYWLDRGHQGRGTMTEAVRALATHALSAWELNRVEIRVATGNRRSRAIPERLGFREEGTLREAEWVGGRPLDTVVYSLLGR